MAPAPVSPDLNAYLTACAAQEAVSELLVGLETERALGREPDLDEPALVLYATETDLMGEAGVVVSRMPDGLLAVRWTYRQALNIAENLAAVLPELAARARAATHPGEEALDAIRPALARLGATIAHDRDAEELGDRLEHDDTIAAEELTVIRRTHRAGHAIVLIHPAHPRALDLVSVLDAMPGAIPVVSSAAGAEPPGVYIVLPPAPGVS